MTNLYYQFFIDGFDDLNKGCRKLKKAENVKNKTKN